MTDDLELGRVAFARQNWAEAYAHLSRAQPAGAEDLERLAIAAHVTGRDTESEDAWEGAHLDWQRRGASAEAARAAFWLGFTHLLRGDAAPARGWLARGERLVGGQTCATRGLLLLPRFMEDLANGDVDAAHALAEQIAGIAQECGDANLLAFAMLCQGEAAIAAGDVALGTKLLDEAMTFVTAGELAPMSTGIIYCAVVEACIDAYDVRRAAEWTDAFHEWCSAQPDLVPYRGNCLVHRSQLLQTRGAWDEALAEAERAEQFLAGHPALGLALYQVGELHRLRGRSRSAEQAYRAAHEHGVDPGLGLARLRLQAGNVAAAAATISRMVEEGQDTPVVLGCAVEVFLAAHDLAAARVHATRLADAAARLNTPFVTALDQFATGSVLLVEGDAARALTALRAADTQWRDLDMPYESARTQIQIGLACRALGDDEAAALHFDTAQHTFEQLGATPDLDAARALMGSSRSVLTDRECEVLRCVAAGMTNRQIATELQISEHTVARHLQNIFLKLGLSSRAAATAYAYEYGIVRTRGEN